MTGGTKILDGLRAALRYAKCRHEYTYWTHCDSGHGWTRICTKCKARETSLVLTDEIRNQT